MCEYKSYIIMQQCQSGTLPTKHACPIADLRASSTRALYIKAWLYNMLRTLRGQTKGLINERVGSDKKGGSSFTNDHMSGAYIVQFPLIFSRPKESLISIPI